MELHQLINPTKAAALKRMSLNLFKYHAAKAGGPTPIPVGGKTYYDKLEVEAWEPSRKQNSRKATGSRETAANQETDNV